MTREDWLNNALDRLRPDFDRINFSLPEKIRVSCGWPSKSGLAEKKRRVGECWSAECSESEHFEIFISPWLKDNIEVLGTLVHEAVHAAVGLEEKHKGRFRTCALAMGLEGKMTATTVGDALKVRLEEIVEEIGDYPHAKLDKSNAPPKQTCRQLKVICEDCACICRMSRKAIDEVGCPTCACGGQMIEEGAETPEQEDPEVEDLELWLANA